VRALFRLQLRRDRIRLPVEVLSVGLLWLPAAGVITTEFADLNSRRALLSVMVISPPLIAVRLLSRRWRPDSTPMDHC
jgi:putative exporter of polyketide antibiotics